MRRVRTLGLSVLAVSLAASVVVRAQESGGSFGGSSWDDEPSGGGSDYGSSGSSDYGSSGSSDYGGSAPSAPADDWAARQAERDRQAAESEARRVAEDAEAERRRLAAEVERERAAADRVQKLALPPDARIAELTWPATPAYPPVSSLRVGALDAPVGTGPIAPSGWIAPAAPAIDAPTHDVAGAWNGTGGLLCGLPPTLLLLGAALLLTRRRTPSPARSGAMRRALPSTALRLSIAFDWTARAQLQTELSAMATRFDMRTRPGLGEAARTVSRLLDAHAPAARYVSWELATGDARSWFQTRANDLRARFRNELVRNEATAQGATYTAREHEGQGLVVVSVLVAAKTPITAPNPAFDLPSLRSAIASVGPLPGAAALALEVIWSPAAENDRMSSYELEKIYPELQRISEGVGARQCAYCRGPFPAELGRCPACGAPVI